MPAPIPAKPTFLQAVFTLYGSIASGLPDLWLDRVPEGTTGYPRAIFEFDGEVPDPNQIQPPFGNCGWNIAKGKFKIFTENDSDLAESLAALVRAAFKPQALQLTFDANPIIRRTFYKVSNTGEVTPAAKPIYLAEIHYEATYGTDD